MEPNTKPDSLRMDISSKKKRVKYDEVFAPVARYETIRAFLACCVEMHVHQMDVEAAYVQGTLVNEIYMTQPETFIDSNQPGKVCKLNRPLYGLKQAGRQWYKEIDKHLTTMNFEKSAASSCVYISKNSDVTIVLYVDDLLIGSKSIDRIIRTKNILKSKFKIKDLGQVRDILGMQIDRDGQTGSIRLP